MKVQTQWNPGRLVLEFEAETGDLMARGKATMVGTRATVSLPPGVSAADVHPDLEALAILLVVERFAGPKITVTRPVSGAFAEAIRTGMRRELGPIDAALAPRAQPEDGRPGLAFSGGADSVAALSVLPDTVVPVFLRRTAPPDGGTATMYREDAALHACAVLAERGLPMTIVESSIEHVRKPVGFPTDWANAIGAVILADVLRLDSVSWGLVAESAYRIGHEEFVDWALRRRRSGWAGAFAAAGLEFLAPVAGVSEVGTTRIVLDSPFGAITQSCIRGGVDRPCGNCWKCFRKSMLDSASSGTWPDDAEMSRLFAVKEVQRRLGELPIPHENVVAWFAARYRGQHPQMRLLQDRVRATETSFAWLEGWYGPSAELFPERYRDTITSRINRYLRPMSPDQEAQFRTWNMHAMLADNRTAQDRGALIGEPVRLTPMARFQASFARFVR